MFGKNAIRKQELRDDGQLFIKEIFYTIQGEGPDAGSPAVFIRLAGCNLACFFCDTDFENGTLMTAEAIEEEVRKLTSELPRTPLIVLTGGEPFRQNFIPLLSVLKLYEVQVETAGTLTLPGLHGVKSTRQRGFSIVCSPKTPKLNTDLIPLIDAYKYIIQAGCVDELDGLPNQSTQDDGKVARIARPWDQEGYATRDTPVFLQACDQQNGYLNKVNLKAAAELCMKFGYRLSVQQHKLADLR